MELANKIVFVSGTNRGIGKALVEVLLERGVKKIYTSARDIHTLNHFNDDRIVKVELNITDTKQVIHTAEKASDIDILINNAGVAEYISILDGPLDMIKRDMDVNYYGTLNMMRAFIPTLKNKNTSVIANVVSIAAFVNFPSLGGYCASKAALFSLTQAARIELEKYNISVHSINPGPIDTDMAHGYDGEKTDVTETAHGILNGLEHNEADIFPDKHGKDMFDIWNNNYRDLEHMVANMTKSA